MKKLLALCVVVCTLWGFAIADDLAYVSFDYCDTPENTLQVQVDPGVETGVCYTLSNGSNNTVTVKLSFVDGTFTNDERQNKACLSDIDVENFGQYMSEYDEFITLKPGEAIKKEAKVMYPKWMDWLYYGCAVYSIVEKPSWEKKAGNFTILMRRAKFIDVIVGDPANAQERGIIFEEFTAEDGKNLSRNPRIRIYQDSSDGKYIMQIKVKNISRVQQDVIITWLVKNILMYKNNFVESRKILKGESLLITKKFETIPTYNLKIKLTASNTPFTFGDQIPVIGTLKEKTNIWIWNMITFITLFGILFFAGIFILLIKNLQQKKNTEVKVIQQKAPAKKINKKKSPTKKITKKIVSKKAPVKKANKKIIKKK